MRWAVLVAFALLAPASATAHPLGFGVLHLEERAPGAVSARFRFSPAEGKDGRVQPRLKACEVVGAPATHSIVNGFEQTTMLRCPEGLSGVSVDLRDLRGRDERVVVRVNPLSGAARSEVLNGVRPEWSLGTPPSMGDHLIGYGTMGVEHILGGVDHLMFVFCLVLLLFDRLRLLLGAVTAFTVGHSVTLALASLELVPIADGPIEASIALSIVLLARELLQRDTRTLTYRAPWLVAGGFGLLHGLGFAGALKETGLPSDAVFGALLAFNVGVELGQLAFIAGILLVAKGLQPLAAAPVLRPAFSFAAFAAGGSAAYWFFERLGAIGG